ncbi:MAG: hypothetical protein JXA09_14785, partial [Anaerolineae bacterium]|nr:hypothetical protein [Anaerolineae bacterium]
MAHHISRIRNRVALLYGATTLTAALLLLCVVPLLSDLTPEAVRRWRIHAIILGVVLLVAAIALIEHYLRPISDLGYALEIGSTPTADLVRDARRIALNAPSYLFVFSTGAVLLLSLVYNLVGAAILADHVFAAYLAPMALSVAIMACGLLLVAFVCQRWMYPVLRYTAARFQVDGLRVTLRMRILALSLSLVVLAVLLPGSYGITQAVEAYRQQRATDVLRVLAAVAQRLPQEGAPAQLLEEAAGQLGASVAHRHLFLVDPAGSLQAQHPEDGSPLAFDGAAWSAERPSTFRHSQTEYCLVPLSADASSPWLGLSYVLRPLQDLRVRGMVAAVGGSALLTIALALGLGHSLSTGLTGALYDVTERLLQAAEDVPTRLGAALPVLSSDEVGGLVLAYNALQGRVRAQLEQVEHKQRQLSALQSLSYKIGTVRDPVYLLAEVVRDVERAFGYHNVSILLADEGGRELRFAATQLADERLRRRRFRVGTDGVVGHVAATREPLLVNDVS